MKPLDHEPAVSRMASELQLSWDDSPVVAIVKHCVNQIEKWLAAAKDVVTIVSLEALACQRLNLKFEEVWDDSQLKEIVRTYAQLGDPIFLTLFDDLDAGTYAALIRLNTSAKKGADRFVAVVDCRGEKASRRFFTRWHEIAHLLTMTRQLELPYHRSTKKPPLERLMDHIAGEIGFFDPLFSNVLGAHVACGRQLTFSAVDAIRAKFCPEASFQSTLIACANRMATSVVLIEAGMGLKKEEQVKLSTPSLFVSEAPKAKLRALRVSMNKAARTAKFRIDTNMSIPPGSLIMKAFEIEACGGLIGQESLAMWRHSNGKPLGFEQVQIDTRRVADRIFAIVQPKISQSVDRKTISFPRKKAAIGLSQPSS